jgi:hypothetical protein
LTPHRPQSSAGIGRHPVMIRNTALRDASAPTTTTRRIM